MYKPFKKAKAKHLKLGQMGEDAACRLIKAKGMEVLARNYRCKKGEIDIIARDGKIICFVEVKTRSISTKSRPGKGLTNKQKKRIYNASKRYLKELDQTEAICRYDLIELRFDTYDFCEARYWPRHFSSHKIKALFSE